MENTPKQANEIEKIFIEDAYKNHIFSALERYTEDDWDTQVWKQVQEYNQTRSVRLSPEELKEIFSICVDIALEKRSVGSDIKRVEVSENTTEAILQINVFLERDVVCCKVKNLISNILEATAIVYIQRPQGLTHEIPFFLKLKSDTNKEQWARILSKGFDKKQEKETYPWVFIVSRIVAEIEKKIRLHKQDFLLSEIVAEPPVWIYEPFIQKNQINTFFGMGGSAKTILSFYFAEKLAREKKIKTLLVDYEDYAGGFSDKMGKLLSLGADKDNFIYFATEQIPLVEQVDKIQKVIKKYGIELVIVDSASMASGDSTSDEKSVLRLVAALKMLQTTIVMIAHQRKNDGEKSPIGSVQFENQSRNVWNFTAATDDFNDCIKHIACKHTKANNTYLRKNPIGFKVSFQQDRILVENENPMEHFSEKFSVMDRMQKLLESEGKLTYIEASEHLDITPKHASKILSTGRNRQLFEKNEDGTWSVMPKGKREEFDNF